MSNCGGAEPFALQVLGDSMEPEFPDGCIVIIEPTTSGCMSGTFVMAEYDDVRWFRLYHEDEQGKKFLLPLNKSYPEIAITEKFEVLGVIIQRNIKRKVKHYHPKLH